MRIFVIGNTKFGIEWVGRLLEELTGKMLSYSEVGEDYDNSALLRKDSWDSEEGIVVCEGASRQNLQCLVEDPKGKDVIIVVGRELGDCVCEVVKGEGLYDMTFEEIINFTIEQNPYILTSICREWMEAGSKIYHKRAVNVEYRDLCFDLKKVVLDLVESLGLVIKKNRMEHILQFCEVEQLGGPVKECGIGKVLLDTEVQRKLESIKHKLRRK